MNNLIGATQSLQQCSVEAIPRRRDITVRANIDSQIDRLKAELQKVEDAKARLEASHLLDSRIDDLEIGMRW